MTTYDENELERRRSKVHDAAEEVQLTLLAPNSIARDTLQRLLAELESSHHLNGVVADGSPSLLLFRLAKGMQPSDITEDNLRFFLWGWTGYFGSSLTFTAYIKGTRHWSDPHQLDSQVVKVRTLWVG